MKISAEQEQLVVAACQAGMTGKAAAAKFSVSASSVVNILRRHGVATTTGRPRTLALDHNAFDELTPASCYWMGFLFADGSIADNHDGQPQLIVDIAEVDRQQLVAFRTFLKSEHKISNIVHKTNLPNETSSAPRRSVAFRVRSTRLVEKLIDMGMTKKGDDRAPVTELERSVDFWRGCIDGDGTVRIHTDTRPGHGYRYAHLLLCGHRPLLRKYQNFLASHDVDTNITNTESGIFQIRIMGSTALKMIRLLYGDTTVALARKLATAQEIMETL